MKTGLALGFLDFFDAHSVTQDAHDRWQKAIASGAKLVVRATMPRFFNPVPGSANMDHPAAVPALRDRRTGRHLGH